MNTFEFTRSLYRRLRAWPLIGPLAEAVRYRRFPVISSASRRYAEQQALLEAQGHALAGLRQSAASHQALLEAQGHALAGLRQSAAGLEAEIYKQADLLNQRMDAQQIAVDKRLEFQRQETLFELRYQGRGTNSALPCAAASPVAPRIVNPEKLQRQIAQGAVRLNIGCGHKPDADRLNVDMRELPGVDIVATVDQLPFEAAAIQEIFCAHLLEHFPIEQLKRSLLPAWLSHLEPGGELRAIVPDADAMLKAYASQQIDFATLRLVTFGGQEYEGDFHHTMFTPESLCDLLVELGLQNVRIEARGRVNGLCLECEVAGNKP